MSLRENIEPGGHATGSATGEDQAGPFRAPHLQCAGHQALIGAICLATQRGRIGTDSSAPPLGLAVWTLRLTTDPSYYEDHAESVELWSPGNLLFQST